MKIANRYLIYNEKGFSVLEVTVFSGIMLLMMMGTISVTTSQNKQIKIMTQKIAINDLNNSIISLMQNPTGCLNNLTPAINPNVTFDSTAVNPSISLNKLLKGEGVAARDLIVVNQEILPSTSIKATAIVLKNLADAGGGKWTGSWEISLLNESSSFSFKPIQLATQSFNVDISVPTAARITGCDSVVVTGGGGSSWNPAGSDIYYNLGNVGIGTVLPTTKLDISDLVGPTQTFSRDDTDVRANDLIGRIQFSSNDTNVSAVLKNVGAIEVQSASDVTTTSPPGNMVFKTSGTSAGSNLLERMRIDSSGDVGIGTVNPVRTKLAVHGPAGDPSVFNWESILSIREEISGGDKQFNFGVSNGGGGPPYVWLQGRNASPDTAMPISLNADGGNVGIGTTNPTNLLEVRKDQNGPTTLRINNFDAVSNNASATLLLGSNSYNFTLNQFGSGSSGTGARAADISQLDSFSANGLAISVSNMMSGDITFYTDGTAVANERMRIANSGNVGIGTSAPTQKLEVNGTLKVNDILYSSDRRMKNQIEDIIEDEAIEKIRKLEPVKFKWNASGLSDLGFIAQDMQLLFPELVYINPDETYSVRLPSLLAPIVASIKHVDSRVSILELENAEMKMALDKMLQKNQHLELMIQRLENKFQSLKK